MHGKDSTGFNFWQNFSLEECEDLARETTENFARLLKQFDEESLNTRVEYKTSKKVAHKNTFRELLSHVLLHPATHRGNIVLKLREENFTPQQTDYIIYLRETKGV